MSISNQRSRLGHIKPDGAMVCHGDGKSLPVRPGSALAPPDRGPDAPTDWIDNSPALPLLHSHEHSLHSQEITRWSGSLGEPLGELPANCVPKGRHRRLGVGRVGGRGQSDSKKESAHPNGSVWAGSAGGDAPVWARCLQP